MQRLQKMLLKLIQLESQIPISQKELVFFHQGF